MIDNSKEFNETIKKLEPMLDFEMDADDVESLKTTSIVSIAISLKRIADSMEAKVPTDEQVMQAARLAGIIK